MKKTEEQKGITLVAIVITIIILLVLAGITIYSLTNTEIFKKAQNAKMVTQEKAVEEKTTLDNYEEQLGIATGAKEYTESKTIEEAQTNDMLAKKVNSVITDMYGNQITVPAGFKIKVDNTTNNATTVDKGIVILDSKENEFVWVPVGKIYTDVEKNEANAKTIEVGRYSFDSTGVKSVYSGNYVEEDREDTTNSLKNWGNTIAKNITKFKNSVETNGGYYIGRYEARKNINGTITEVGTDTVWNNITQPNASIQAQNMYSSSKFISDLVNSYAWDTAVTFIQKCTEQKLYSRQNSLNTTLSQTGTNTKDTKDVQCNIFDMASNLFEWTTETSDNSDNPCTIRGGSYHFSSNYTSNRNRNTNYNRYDDLGFRPILFVTDKK